MSLLDDLTRAEHETKTGGRWMSCSLCDLIRATEDEDTREALKAAAAGKIGIRKLYGVLHANGTGVGQKTIVRHRREEHAP